MKKGQIFEGIIERVDFPNKGLVKVEEEGKDARYVTVKKMQYRGKKCDSL